MTAQPVRAPIARPLAVTRPAPIAKPGAARRTKGPGASDAVDAGAPPGAREAELQLALAAQAARFDAMMKVLAEQQREINAIVDLGMAQTKRDDALMNQWIRLI